MGNPITSISIGGKNGSLIALGSTIGRDMAVFEWSSESYVIPPASTSAINNYSIAGGSPTQCSAVSLDGTMWAIGHLSGAVSVYSANSSLCIASFCEHRAPVTGVQFLPTSRGLVTCGDDGRIICYDLNRKQVFRRFQVVSKSFLASMTSSIKAEAKTDEAKASKLQAIDAVNAVVEPPCVSLSCISVDPSGEIIAVGARDGDFSIYLYDLRTGKLLDELNAHTAPITCLKFSPNGTGQLLSGSWDKDVRIWDIFSAGLPCEVLNETSEIIALDFNPNGKEIALALANGSVNFWSIEEGKQTASLRVTRDISGGRREREMRTAQASGYGKAFTSLMYISPTRIIGSGDSKWICVYDLLFNREEDVAKTTKKRNILASAICGQTLVRKIEITSCLDIDGTREEFGKLDITSSGAMVSEIQKYDDFMEEADVEMIRLRRASLNRDRKSRKVVDATLDLIARNSKPSARVMSLSVSPDGTEILALTPFGSLIFKNSIGMASSVLSEKKAIGFDPLDLNPNVTTENILSCALYYGSISENNKNDENENNEDKEQKVDDVKKNIVEPLVAVEMSLKLFDFHLFSLLITKLDERNFAANVVEKLPIKYWSRFVNFIARYIESYPLYQKGIYWALTFLRAKTPIFTARDAPNMIVKELSQLKTLQRAVFKKFDSVEQACTQTLRYTMACNKVSKAKARISASNPRQDKSQEDQDENEDKE